MHQNTILVTVFLLFTVSDQLDQEKLVANFLDKNARQLKDQKLDDSTYLLFANKTKHRTTTSPPSTYLHDNADSNIVLMDTVGCDAGWAQFSGNGLCYKTSPQFLTWYDAEDWCYNQRSGSHLASVHNKQEYNFVGQYFTVNSTTRKSNIVWVGLRRKCDNTNYLWTDGSALDFLWWQAGYPQAEYAEQSCATMWFDPTMLARPSYGVGQLDDLWQCGVQKTSAICKYDPTSTAPHIKYTGEWCTTTVVTIPPTTQTTPTTPTTTTTTTATTTTTTPTTTTTTPTTTTTTTTPTTTTTTPTTTTTTPTTTTTTPTTTTTTPTTTTTTPTTTTTTPTTPTTTTFEQAKCSMNCPANWVQLNGACHMLLQGIATYAQAQAGCAKFGANIVKITSIDYNDQLRKTFGSNSDRSFSEQAWISKDNLSFTNWAVGKPSQSFGSLYEYCPVFSLSTVNGGNVWGHARGVWFDYPCQKSQKYTICVK